MGLCAECETGISASAAKVYLNASSKDIAEVMTIAKFYKNLEEINVSNNRISSLAPLAEMQGLHTLDASRNRIVDVLAFDPASTKESGSIRLKLASVLVRANLAFNKISHLGSLKSHPWLREINLDGNSISSLRSFSNAQSQFLSV